MAKVKLLVDSDIIIDYLKGIKPAQELFRINCRHGNIRQMKEVDL